MEYTAYDTRLAAYALVIDADDRILLSWFNGRGSRGRPGWSLPGGGVEFEESLEEGLHREVLEETGLTVRLTGLLLANTVTEPGSRRPSGRGFKAVRIVYRAEVTGGTLGTLEVGGTTDRAEWVPISDLARGEVHRSSIVDRALEAHAAAERSAGDRKCAGEVLS